MNGHAIAHRVVIGDGGVHFHLVLTDLGAIVDALAHQIGRGKGGFDIAKFEQHVAFEIVRAVRMQRDRARRNGFLRGMVGGKLPNFQLDFAQRFLRRRIVDGRNRHNWLATIAHTITRQDVFGARDRQHAEWLVAFGTGDDRLDAWEFHRFGNVDLEDFGMRIRTAENASGEHSRDNKISGVFGTAGDLFRAVDHRHVAADVMRGQNVVHGVNPAAQSDAACFTASMIFT